MAKDNDEEPAAGFQDTSSFLERLRGTLVSSNNAAAGSGDQDLEEIRVLVLDAAKSSGKEEPKKSRDEKILEGIKLNDHKNGGNNNNDSEEEEEDVVIVGEEAENFAKRDQNKKILAEKRNGQKKSDNNSGQAPFSVTRNKGRKTYASRERFGLSAPPPQEKTARRTRSGNSASSHSSNESRNGISMPNPREKWTSGASKSNGSSNNFKSSTRIPHANEGILQDLIEEAEFELRHDPYRGMALKEEEEGDRPNNPWTKCKFSFDFKKNMQSNRELILDIDDCTKDDTDGLLLSKAWVEETCHSHCPSSLRWTQESVLKQRQAARKKKGKKRKLPISDLQPPDVAQRPIDINARCPCDYNPWCTGSLGGVCNEIWKDMTEATFATKKQQHENYQAMIRVQKANERGNQNPYENLDRDTFEFKDSEDVMVDASNTSPNKAGSDDEVEVLNDERSPVVKDETNYAPETAKELGQIRPCTMVKSQPIQDYLERLLLAAPPEVRIDATVPKLLDIFINWQKSLIFSNPLRDDLKATNSLLPIALPPGISNLGATCYLNTQLQCLAQNRAFLKGIAAWRAVEKKEESKAGSNGEDRMNTVLTQLQALMAKMVEGEQRTINTIEFSTALGLETDEQQDPNEFARLLFERMHDAFQQQESLKTLLPSLFEGNTTYSTTCLHCNTVSTRRESFMDLNLPIVALPKEEDGGKQKKKSSILDYFSGQGAESTSIPNADVDTTLQYCLDEYATHERLEGDNQYHCSNCDCKRDATRDTALGSLPPVLNVQLSRYIFDMQTLSKKKLTDKVLLPRKLEVQTKTTDAVGDAISTKIYWLAAVQNHKGNSAYRGHYVAEVQDFLTGQWFEFNDEKVTHLENGPSCSYTPSSMSEPEDTDMPDATVPEKSRSNGRKKKASKLKGSEEAYNTFYVEESFLGKTVLEAFQGIEEQQTELLAVLAKQKEPTKHDVLQSAALKRHELFQELTRLCLEDGKATERLRARKDGLKNDMLAFKSEVGEKKGPVWVDGNLLRQFVAGNRLEDLLRTQPGRPLLQHKHLLCQHRKGLHPRIARRGKLLPRQIYNSYETLIAQERCRFLGGNCEKKDSNESALWDHLNDYFITPRNHLHCEECAESYRRELKKKLDLVNVLKYLYAALDTKHGKGDHDVFVFTDDESDADDSGSDGGSEEYAFVASKKSLTAFRKKIEQDLLKSLSDVAATTANSSTSAAVTIDGKDGVIGDSSTSRLGVNIECLSEGLDALELSKFGFDDESNSNVKDLDIRINSSITCPHGNCTEATKKQKVRWLRSEVWAALKKVFPMAIEHKVFSNGKDAKTECAKCKQEEKSQRDLEDKLAEWKTDSLVGKDLKNLHQDKKGDKALANILNYSAGKAEASAVIESYVPVARSDVVLWRKMITAVDGMKRKKTDATEVKKQLEGWFSGREQDWTNHDKAPLEECFFRKLTCTHGLAMRFFEPDTKSEEGSHHSRGVLLLKGDQYENLSNSIYDLMKILASDDDVCDLVDDERPVATDECTPLNILVRQPLGELDDEDCETIRLVAVPGGNPVFLRMTPKFCEDPECCKDYVDSLLPDDEDKCLIGDADDPIVVEESDTEDNKGKFRIQIYEVEAGVSMDAALKGLSELDALPGMAKVKEAQLNDFPRRSTRKRKARFPAGVILGQGSVEARWDNNLAALRLNFFQIEEKSLHQKWLLIFSPDESETSPPADKKPSETVDLTETDQPVEPRVYDLPFGDIEKLLKDIYVERTGDKELERCSDPSKSFVLLRQSDPENDLGAAQDSLLDALLEKSNLISKDIDNGKKGSKRSETGFSGTFLSSFRPPSSDGEAPPKTQDDDKKQESSDKTSGKPTEGQQGDDDAMQGQKSHKLAAENDVIKKKRPSKDARWDEDDAMQVDDGDKMSTANDVTEKRPREVSPSDDDASSEEKGKGKKRKRRTKNDSSTQSVLESVGEYDESKKVSTVLDQVKAICPDNRKALEAARWAVQNNKGTPIEELLQIALNKCFD